MLNEIYNYVKNSNLVKFVKGEIIKEKFKRKLTKSMKKQNQLIPYINKPGIVFSFDDSFRINDWYKNGKDIFGYYDVKVTFNINAFHHFEDKREHNQEEIDMLIELQSNGHEIAHHGFSHRNSVEYSNEVGVSSWIDEEIIPLFNWMDRQTHSKTKEKFKKPVTFAFPSSAYTSELITSIVPSYFKIVRGNLNEVTFPLHNQTGYSTSICIDRNQIYNLKFLKKAMKIAKLSGSNLILMCHSILHDEEKWEAFGWGDESIETGEYRVSPKLIKSIIAEARKNNMEFYTTAELAGIATFIDPNFEKHIRKEVLKFSGKWILIKDLLYIKELDVSNKNITNLGGIEYFLNLESLNLSNNNISDLRLLEKLSKLKNLEIRNNPINNQQPVYNLEEKIIINNDKFNII